MKTADIAKVVLERRSRMSPIVFQGEMLEKLGSEGLSEALQRRWLVPNEDSGYLQVTNEEALVLDMQAQARLQEDCDEPGCPEDEKEEESEEKSAETEGGVEESSHLKQYQFKKKGAGDAKKEEDADDDDTSKLEKDEKKRAQGEHDRAKADACDDGPLDESLDTPLRRAIAGHANRVIGEEMYGGSVMGASTASNRTSTPTSSASPKPRDVGADVTVVENGKTYQGKVEAKTQDGRYKVSFGGERPAQEREYTDIELG